ncbi:hypothetical protein FRC00_009041 [Tulasnella sp. 408]|nr:hypothetical protein FRC00_009041 [Tulasnella sp. 408]
MGIGLDRVLKYGLHNATIQPNYRNLQDVGSGVLVSKINYLNEPEPATTSHSSEATGSVSSGSSSSGASHLKVTVGVPVGAIGLLILVLAAVYGCWKRRFGRNSNRQSDGAVGEKAPQTASAQDNEPSPISVPPASFVLDTPTVEKGTPTASPVTTPLPTMPAIPLSEATASSPMTAERVALIQTLTRQGLSPTQITAVLDSMSNAAEPSASARRQLEASDRTGQADDPPPVYDFKDRTL